MSYEILDHTADEKFRANGESLEEAFEEATKAFAEIVGSNPEGGDIRHEIEVEAESHEALLFDFLNRLIFLQDTEDVAVCQLERIRIEDTEKGHELEATVLVDKIDAGMNFQDIKAPTYNEMRLDYEEGDGWVIEAVLDI